MPASTIPITNRQERLMNGLPGAGVFMNLPLFFLTKLSINNQ